MPELKDFEEWFAIRVNHSDDEDHWPGRLIFGLESGIRLKTARFIEPKKVWNDKTFHSNTITGWLDYQRPATLINPQFKEIAGHTFSVDTPAMRESYTLVADAVLKNVFLTDLEDKIFTGITVNHPAINAWVCPKLVRSENKLDKHASLPELSVKISSPYKREFILKDKKTVSIASFTEFLSGENTKLSENTTLSINFPRAINYAEATEIIWRISTLFEFLIGMRLTAPVFYLHTSIVRKWNDRDTHAVAEFHYRPSFYKRRKKYNPFDERAFITEGDSPVTIESLFEFLISKNDETTYLASIITTSENNDTSFEQTFGELIGCLENFDKRKNGSGSEKDLSGKIERLRNIIQKHGEEQDLTLFERISSNVPNSYSLLKRLERLHETWKTDGFRGDPDLTEIRNLRNLIPHGRGLNVSKKNAQKMIWYGEYLQALGRYHVLKALGYSRDDIAKAFMRKPQRYGMFVPQKFFQDNDSEA